MGNRRLETDCCPHCGETIEYPGINREGIDNLVKLIETGERMARMFGLGSAADGVRRLMEITMFQSELESGEQPYIPPEPEREQ